MIGNGFRAGAVVLMLTLSGCFGPDSPEDQLKSIEALQAKNFPMTKEQQSELSEHLTKGREALAAGKKEDAGAAFEAALAILKVAEDTALFNKAD